MSYELRGLHPANLIDTCDSEAEAFADVRDLRDAGWSPDDLPPGQVQEGSGALVAEGATLAQLASQAGPDLRSRTV
jgi:hypothetical protein